MENWQKTHIEKNLPVLIDITTCSAGLKAGLRAKELLTKEQDAILTALGRNEGLVSEAKLLYEIMMTRSRGYNALMEVLCDTRQDGAFKILQGGLQEPESVTASSDWAFQLMNMRLHLGNYKKCFRDVFSNFTINDARELLRNKDLKQELEEMLLNQPSEIKLDGHLPLTPELYIPRLLSNRLQLDPRVFTLDTCEDVFVFTNISRMELAQLVKPHATRSSSNQRGLVTCRHIYLDDEEDWDDMVAISETPIHLIRKEDGGYILERTSKVTEVLHNYGLREGRTKEAFVTEDTFVEELLLNNKSKGALICDVAGMGKTWLMQSLAVKIHYKSGNFATFFIELSSFSKFLTGPDRMTPYNHALTTVLNYASRSKLGSNLLQNYAPQNGLKIVFVLDGYDEIIKDDVEVVKSNLEFLSKFDHIRMIISSRPNMRATLQNTFNLIAYDMMPFQTEQQVHCIVNQWANVWHRHDSELRKLDEFALQCIKSVRSIQKDSIHDFLGVPLKCRILATVNEQKAKQLYKMTHQKPVHIIETATIKSVYDLYTIFVDALIDKVAGTLPLDARNDFMKSILTFYTHMALELLFPDISKLYLKKCIMDNSMEEFFSRVGVACFSNVNQRLEFIHRSFAEYFVGRFFADFWNNIEQYSTSFADMVGSYFVRTVMIVNTVDGEVKIHPDPFKQRDAGWDFIYEPGFYTYSPSFLDYKKAFDLKYPFILRFMNINLKVNKLQVARWVKATKRNRNLAASFETEAITTKQSLQPMDNNSNYCDGLCGLRKWLAKSSFATTMACIDERLTNILSLYVKILISFFDLEDRVCLLLQDTKVQIRGSRDSAAWLLCRAATSKSPENAVELFNLFSDSEENFLSLLCRRYPQEYWSPLEVAIITEDLDMILYFVDKVNLPFDRLFFACVAVDKKLAEPDVDPKLKIMKMVLGSSDRVFDFLCTDSLCRPRVPEVNITKYSFQLLLKFLENSERSISSIKSENKRCIVEKCLEDCNDEELVNLLVTLYGNSDDNKLFIVNLDAGRTFTADEVFDALDLVEVRDAFSKGQFGGCDFCTCLKLETLKVLTGILPDFSHRNFRKWNYLHVATSMLKIDWVKHLINSGCELDQVDEYGDTALLCASLNGKDNPKSMLAVARLLVENGANVYAKDFDGRNVAHRVFIKCRNAESKDLCEWVTYFLENGYYRLWEMRDKDGKTPKEMLFIVAGKNSPMTTDVLRLLESYSVVSAK